MILFRALGKRAADHIIKCNLLIETLLVHKQAGVIAAMSRHRKKVFQIYFDALFLMRLSLIYGVLTLSKPTNMQMVAQNLRILCATRERMRQMEAKQATVEEKIEEIRLVNRAKWLLIECLGMTEPEAHRYIEKQSMDQRISKREAAEAVIKTYK